MSIQNPTPYTLRKIHSFDLLNAECIERLHIDVLEPLGTAAGKLAFVAIPHHGGYTTSARFCGNGQSVEEALNDCLGKLAKHPWEVLRDAQKLNGD